MITYASTNRPLTLTTPLGPDALLVAGFEGHEGLCELFHFRLDLRIARAAALPFEKLLGQKATLTHRLPAGEERLFSGILSRLVQDDQDEFFTHCRADLVPRFWLWTRRFQSRIFQQQSVPDILHKVLDGLDVVYQFTRTYHPREYCVQYRETDFAFACRLMEEEGIHYYFLHRAEGEQLVVTDQASVHPELPAPSAVRYERKEGGQPDEPRVRAWSKEQTIAASKYVVWDHHFELPDQHLEGSASPPESLSVGKVSHQLKGGHNAGLEIFDGFGGYGTHFDAINREGQERAEELRKVHEEASWVARLRLEEETARSLEARGTGDYGHFLPGHVFQLIRHFDAEGKYLLARVEHEATQSGFRSGDEIRFSYENRFACLPADLPYRPRRVTPRPMIGGTQTAVVVGPAGKDTYLDKYGRVKVQFHWDRQGKKDAGSSCWLRVAQVWAGKRWGAFFWPRIGQEVVVAFEEADPDRPLVVGSVYNAANMPPFELPGGELVTGIKSCSVGKDADPLTKFNGILFHDQIGDEHVEVHSERSNTTQSESDQWVRVGQHFTQVVGGFPGMQSGSGAGGGGHTPPPETPTNPSHTQTKESKGGHDEHHGAAPTFADALKTGWASHLEFTFGDHGSHVLGLAGEYVVGTATNVLVNPVGFAAQFGGPNPFVGGVTGAIGGLMGETNLCVGAETSLHYGPSIEIHRGEHIEGGGHALNPVATAAGLILGGIIMGSNVLAATRWKEAEGQLCGVLAESIRGAALALLVGVESALAWGSEAERKARQAKELVELAAEQIKKTAIIALDSAVSKRRDFLRKVMENTQKGIEFELQYTKNKVEDSLHAIAKIQVEKAIQKEFKNHGDRRHWFMEYEVEAKKITMNTEEREVDLDHPRGYTQWFDLEIAGQCARLRGKTFLYLDSPIIKLDSDHVFVVSHKNILDVAPEGIALITYDKPISAVLEMTGNEVGLGVRMVGTFTFLSSLDLTQRGIELKTGVCSIEMDAAKGITLSAGPSKLVIAPEGVTINGLKVETKAELVMAQKAAIMQQDVQGPIQVGAALIKE